MAKGTIDQMVGGKVKLTDNSFTYAKRWTGYYINSSGVPTKTTINGAHLNEYTITEAGKGYKFTYYNQAATTSYDIGYYRSDDTFISGIHSDGSQTTKVNTFITPAETAYILVYGINRGTSRYQESSMESLGDLFMVKEIRTRRAGDTNDQIVWPNANTPKEIVLENVTEHYYFSQTNYSGYSHAFRASGETELYVTADVVEKIGGITFRTIATNVELSPTTISYKNGASSTDVIDGEVFQAFRMTTARYGSITRQVIMTPDLKTETRAAKEASIVFTYQGLASTTIDVIRQNCAISLRESVYSLISYTGACTPSGDIYEGTASATIWCKIIRRKDTIEHWNSNHDTYAEPEEESEYRVDSGATVTPSNSGCTITSIVQSSGRIELSFTSNSNNDPREFTISFSYYDSKTRQTCSNSIVIRQKGQASNYNFSNLGITDYHYDTSTSGTVSWDTNTYQEYTVPAKGGGAYPHISISLLATKGGNSGYLTGTISNGESSCRVSGTVGGQSISVYVDIQYAGATNGYVSGEPRGIIPYQRTTIGTGLKVTASYGGMSVTVPSGAGLTVYQQENKKWLRQAGNFIVDSFTLVPRINSTVLSTESGNYKLDIIASTSVELYAVATAHGTTDFYGFSSEETTGGETTNVDNQPVTLTEATVTSNGNPVDVSNFRYFTADNSHNTSVKSYDIEGKYETSQRINFTIVQKKDSILPSTDTSYTVTLRESSGTNTLWAGGGDVYLIAAAAYSEGQPVWESDGSPAGTSPQQQFNMDDLEITLQASNPQAFPFTLEAEVRETNDQYNVYRLRHNDMHNFVGTDSIKITAKNHVRKTELQYSITNALNGGTAAIVRPELVWGDPYPISKNYGIRILNLLFTSLDDAAPSNGATSPYSLYAYHKEGYVHNGYIVTDYITKYTSYSSVNNDYTHYEIDSSNYYADPEYAAQPVEGQEWEEVDGDDATLTASENWVTINQSSIQIAARQGGNTVRSAVLTATNTSAPDTVNTTATIYQRALVKWKTKQGSGQSFDAFLLTLDADASSNSPFTKERADAIPDDNEENIGTQFGTMYLERELSGSESNLTIISYNSEAEASESYYFGPPTQSSPNPVYYFGGLYLDESTGIRYYRWGLLNIGTVGQATNVKYINQTGVYAPKIKVIDLTTLRYAGQNMSEFLIIDYYNSDLQRVMNGVEETHGYVAPEGKTWVNPNGSNDTQVVACIEEFNANFLSAIDDEGNHNHAEKTAIFASNEDVWGRASIEGMLNNRGTESTICTNVYKNLNQTTPLDNVSAEIIRNSGRYIYGDHLFTGALVSFKMIENSVSNVLEPKGYVIHVYVLGRYITTYDNPANINGYQFVYDYNRQNS